MKKIKLTQGKYAIVDDEDYPYLSRFKWFCIYDNHKYVVRHSLRALTSKGKVFKVYIEMESLIIPPKQYSIIAHKNNDGLDCRKENLFYESYSIKRHRADKQNGKTSSKYKGVIFLKNSKSKKWSSRIYMKIDNIRKQFYLGNFYTEKEAGIAYNEKARELYGEYAYQNKIE